MNTIRNGALCAIAMTWGWWVAAPAGAVELPRTMWSELTFVDVAEGHEAEFREQVREWLVPLAQHRIDERELWAWALYEVVYADAAYDHVIVRQGLDVAALAPVPVPDATLEAAFSEGSGRSRNPSDAARSALRELSGLYRVEARGLYANEHLETDLERRERPWLTATWLRTAEGGDAAYREQMDGVWESAIGAWVSEGGPAGFSGYRLVQPAAGMLGHDRVRVAQYDVFPSLLLEGGLAEAFAAAHPDGDHEAARRALDEAAPVVGSEVWRLVELARRRPPPPSEGP